MPAPILSVRDLTIDFHSHRGNTRAVEGISFDLHRGETLAIVGESGSGKSVTSLALMGLVPMPPGRIASGEARFQSASLGEVDLLTLSDAQLRQVRGNDIGMIFQEPMTSLNPVYHCGPQVVEALRLHTNLSEKEAHARTVELFTMARLPRPEKIFASYPHEISGGQKQRVMIAMAMACNPALLIADEPTTALDVTVQAQVLRLIDELRREHNTAVIFITHDLGVVAEIADRILVMYRGRVVEQGSVLDIFTNPQHPYTKGLLACRPKLSVGRKKLPVVADFMRETADGGFISTESATAQVVEAEMTAKASEAPSSDTDTTKMFPVEHSVSRPEIPHFGLESAPSAESGLPLPLSADPVAAASQTTPTPQASPASQGSGPGLAGVPQNDGTGSGGEVAASKALETAATIAPRSVAQGFNPGTPGAVGNGGDAAWQTPDPGALGSAEPLLQVENLQVYFPIRKGFFNRKPEFVRAVDGVSFAIYPGETVGLVGESGCGKTTLGRALLRLVEPTAGRILFGGDDWATLPAEALRRRRRDFQMVFQDPYAALNPMLTVGEAIWEPMRVHSVGGSGEQQKAKVLELLRTVGLREEHFQRYPHEFSGGQRQRICIARALALQPKCIICDESVSALDVSVQAQVLNLLNDLKREFGITYLFITHDLSVARFMSDRLLVMRQGQLVESGPAADIYANPRHAYTQQLLAAIPRDSPADIRAAVAGRK
ncbi:dipeptide ABC transporter ATP-binding protein [Hymenobacter psychrophilus]|uniref:ABC-type dipeptide/oligopeptide/nickel transport system, ATPase component n=1 Tax=Hymenobacter psychrophilus TaxID=651662 RepID=A0A1H3GJI8_9BACT|nr:dipeptide ABC transporter ATP-binding protein [Hymenobacter psychrophilus]SDY03493.1 ABC-type dipeptide/oligopeptide/nickel transport system, ATPase component [Hymenobacter psychrophilus]